MAAIIILTIQFKSLKLFFSPVFQLYMRASCQPLFAWEGQRVARLSSAYISLLFGRGAEYIQSRIVCLLVTFVHSEEEQGRGCLFLLQYSYYCIMTRGVFGSVQVRLGLILSFDCAALSKAENRRRRYCTFSLFPPKWST